MLNSLINFLSKPETRVIRHLFGDEILTTIGYKEILKKTGLDVTCIEQDGNGRITLYNTILSNKVNIFIDWTNNTNNMVLDGNIELDITTSGDTIYFNNSKGQCIGHVTFVNRLLVDCIYQQLSKHEEKYDGKLIIHQPFEHTRYELKLIDNKLNEYKKVENGETVKFMHVMFGENCIKYILCNKNSGALYECNFKDKRLAVFKC